MSEPQNHVFSKIRRKIRRIIVNRFYRTLIFPFLYRSYWHYLFHKLKNKPKTNKNYFTAQPNPGAGIGHQIANWISGYWFARYFQLQFAHIPFPHSTWESFLGFGNMEASAIELIKISNYKLIRLPLFNESNLDEIVRIKNIIESYNSEKIVFLAEQDQEYQDQYGLIEAIQSKFFHAPIRNTEKIIYSKRNLNVAIHIRRGDIGTTKQTNNPNLSMRWQSNTYFLNALKLTLKNLNTNKPITIYLFSQGSIEDFREFYSLGNIHFCFDMNAQESFLHMVYADVLITSKSSFSYKPALLSKGIKICPEDFWHGYPSDKQWILADKNGNFDEIKLRTLNI